MPLEAGTINSIISGATNLTNSFLGFGADIYAINHQQMPSDTDPIIITVPTAPQQPTNNNTLLYVGIGIGALILILAIVFLIVNRR